VGVRARFANIVVTPPSPPFPQGGRESARAVSHHHFSIRSEGRRRELRAEDSSVCAVAGAGRYDSRLRDRLRRDVTRRSFTPLERSPAACRSCCSARSPVLAPAVSDGLLRCCASRLITSSFALVEHGSNCPSCEDDGVIIHPFERCRIERDLSSLLAREGEKVAEGRMRGRASGNGAKVDVQCGTKTRSSAQSATGKSRRMRRISSGRCCAGGAIAMQSFGGSMRLGLMSWTLRVSR
jgi:hypothetical protein